MNRHIWVRILCIVLIIATLVPVCASAAAKAYLLKTNTKNVTFHYKNGGDTVMKKAGTQLLYWGTHKKGNSHMLEVCTSSGTRGYVYEKYLKSYGTFKKSGMYRTKAYTAVRKSRSDSAKAKTHVKANRFIYVIGKKDGWSYVRTLGGTIGWVRNYQIASIF